MEKIMRKRLFQWLRAAMLVCATVWVVSCSTDDNAIIKPADRPGAAYRAVLQGLDWGADTTFVYGHKTPDVDAVCSSLSYARLMRALGYNCKAKVSSPINRETQFIAQRFGFDVPELKTAVAEAIFGPSLRPGVTYSKAYLSRKQIVPKIMEILQ